MRKFIHRLRFVLNIKRFLPFLFEFFTSRKVSKRKKALSLVILIGYIIFPFDAIPDFITFFGLLDDLAVLTFVLQQIVKMAPQELKDKYQVSE